MYVVLAEAGGHPQLDQPSASETLDQPQCVADSSVAFLDAIANLDRLYGKRVPLADGGCIVEQAL